jgi:hypothetical protein
MLIESVSRPYTTEKTRSMQMQMKNFGIGLAVVLIAGCASVAGEKVQPITVQTVLENKEVAGVGCTLANDTGKWFVTSPASVMVHKSTGDLTIDCAKDGTVGHETAVSKSNGAVWGNILIGGGIGYIIDRNTGAGFDYPAVITVMLRRVGDALGIATPAAATSAQTAGAPTINIPESGTAAAAPALPASGAVQTTK